MNEEINLQVEEERKFPARISKRDLVEIGITFLMLVIAIVVLNLFLAKLFPGSRGGLDPLTTSRIGGYR